MTGQPKSRKNIVMSLITCPECNKQISEAADSCPKCGYHLSPEKVAEIKENAKKEAQKLKKGCGIGCLVIILIGVFAGLIDYYSSNGSSSTSSPSETVQSSSWDGSVWQVKSWLKANLKDPGSLDFIEWSPVQKTTDGGFMVRVKYRAKNSLGGYVIDNKIFFLDSTGKVIYTQDY